MNATRFGISSLSRVFLLAAGLSTGLAAQPAHPATGAVKEFSLTAEKFMFKPDRIEVTQGDTVRITVHSLDGTHGFAIKQFSIKKTVPKGGEPITAEFVASVAGTFEFKCSEYCGRGHSGMKGQLIVKPAASQGAGD
jgi:cytochrome c oxidase subunit 2